MIPQGETAFRDFVFPRAISVRRNGSPQRIQFLRSVELVVR
jgi:hypothetical protein